MRPAPVGAPHDRATKRHVPLPIPHARVSVAFEVGRAAGERERDQHEDRRSHRTGAYAAWVEVEQPAGEHSGTQLGFAYGNSSAATSLTSTSSAQAATAALTGLTPGSTYHYELCVTLVFTDCSADQTVTTPPNLPAISGEQVSGITSSGAALKATVNPAQSLAPGLTAEPVTETLSTLKPGTLYHARAVAANSAGTTDGPDFTFVTSAAGGAPGLAAVRLAPSS